MLHHNRPGLTLLEMVSAVSIVGVVLALVVPAISSVRLRSRDTQSLANLRTHAQAATLYAGDFRDFAPFIADPDATYSIARGGGITMEFEFFGSSEAWVVALVDDYYQIGLADGWRVFVYPGPEPGIYQYAPSFIARPAFWNMKTRAVGQLGPNRLSSTTFPANKAIFIEHNPRVGLPVWGAEGIFNHAKFGMAFVDGSARRIPWDQLLQPVREGEGSAYGARFSVGLAGMHTIDGVLGRDVP